MGSAHMRKFPRVHGRVGSWACVLMGTGGAAWSPLWACKDCPYYFLPEYQDWNPHGPPIMDVQIVALESGLDAE